MLQIRLLGQFDTRIDGKRVTIPTRAAQSLLAYLVLTAGTPHRREKLAGISGRKRPTKVLVRTCARNYGEFARLSRHKNLQRVTISLPTN